jgi:hypothetical protein
MAAGPSERVAHCTSYDFRVNIAQRTGLGARNVNTWQLDRSPTQAEGSFKSSYLLSPPIVDARGGILYTEFSFLRSSFFPFQCRERIAENAAFFGAR